MDYLQYNSNCILGSKKSYGFKPYYKWITFNTPMVKEYMSHDAMVLNLIINGLPSILYETLEECKKDLVLNLIINGLPSILSYIQPKLLPYFLF